MEKKNLLLLLMLTATAINAIGQSGFLRLPGSSYIDNVADSEAVKLGMLPAPMGEQRDERFWITRKTTATYSFAHNQAKYRGTDPQDTHAFVPELFLESAGGWSLNVGGLYAHSSYRQEFLGFLGSPGYRVEVEGNTYGISVQPAYDTFSFWNPENRPEFMKHSKLVTGLGFAYTHDDVEARFNSVSGATKYGTDGFSLSPNLVFVQPLSEKFITFLIPAYSMEWRHSERNGGSATSDNNYGVFTLTARGDYKIAERFFTSAFATWNSDITSKPDGPKFDWAEFGAQLRFAISERLALRAGYSYEAFHPYFEAHHCFARIEANF